MPLYPGALDFITADLDQRIGTGAAVAAEVIREHIQAGPRSGVHWPDMPRRSSAPGEYPQEQTGDLLRSVGVEHERPTEYVVGSVDNPPPEAAKLEFTPVFYGGRHWLSKAMEDVQTHALMLAAAAK